MKDIVFARIQLVLRESFRAVLTIALVAISGGLLFSDVINDAAAGMFLTLTAFAVRDYFSTRHVERMKEIEEGVAPAAVWTNER